MCIILKENMFKSTIYRTCIVFISIDKSELIDIKGEEELKRIKMHAGKRFWAYIFIAPAIIHIISFRLGPSISTLFLSLQQPFGLNITGNNGLTLDNYRSLLNKHFGEVLLNTLYYVGGGMFILVMGSLLVALLLNRGSSKDLFRAIYFYPYTVIMVATGIIWAYGFRADGFVNHIISIFGFPNINWLKGAGNLAMPALIFTTSWKYLGYFAIIYLSGLQAIPRTQYDAAEVDGANAVQRFWNITVPHLRPIVLFVMVMRSIELLRQFAIPEVMTGGGPFNKTNVLPLDIYRQAFTYFNMNKAAAESFVLISIAVVFSILQFQLVGKNRDRRQVIK